MNTDKDDRGQPKVYIGVNRTNNGCFDGYPWFVMDSKFNDITEKIIGCVHRVSNGLGSGFLEKVYENALALELRHAGLRADQQHRISVSYSGEIVGEFAADLLVEDSIIVELKAAKTFDDVHVAQCLNYLKATGLKLCLLVNFGKPRVEIRRIILGHLSEEPQMRSEARRS